MKFSLKIYDIKTVDELEGSWTHDDFTALLTKFDFSDADKLTQSELKDFLFMAISDVDPDEAAAIVLDYRLSERLTEGQIHNLSHEMLREKVCENYSDISLHKILFDTNQLLYKAYNGKFPKAKASIIEFEMLSEQVDQSLITKELVLQAFRTGLTDRNLLNRLFKDQLAGKVPFPEAEGILWNLDNRGNGRYSVTASEKWLNREDFKGLEFESNVFPFSGNVEND